MASSCDRHAMICLKSNLARKSEDRAMLIAYVPLAKSSSSLRKADCCRAHRGLAANLWRYRLSAGFLDRIPGLEIGRFGS
jgi:hypothetical protein